MKGDESGVTIGHETNEKPSNPLRLMEMRIVDLLAWL
jgi:hypothetical protein